MWIDTHAHVTADAFDEDRSAIIDRASEMKVDRIIAIGSGYGASECAAAAELAQSDERIFASVGVHPHDAKDWNEEALAELTRWIDAPRVVAIGECGLDYYYDNSPRKEQRDALARQLALAREHQLPVIIHVRCQANDAYDAFLDIWKSESAGALEGTVHCFTGTTEFAKQALDQGLHISFSGILTFKKAQELRDTAAIVPLDRVLVETDAPFLAPMPHRGKRNEPAWVVHVGNCLAKIHNLPEQELAAITTANAERLFRLPTLEPQA